LRDETRRRRVDPNPLRPHSSKPALQLRAELRVRQPPPLRLAVPAPLAAHVKHAVLTEADEQEHGRIRRAVVDADVVVLDRRERLHDVNVGVKHIVHDAFGQNPLPENETSVPKARVLALERFDVTGIQRSEEHTSELQSRENLVCRLLLEKKKQKKKREQIRITSYNRRDY